jgi:hypothetical protein
LPPVQWRSTAIIAVLKQFVDPVGLTGLYLFAIVGDPVLDRRRLHRQRARAAGDRAGARGAAAGSRS